MNAARGLHQVSHIALWTFCFPCDAQNARSTKSGRGLMPELGPHDRQDFGSSQNICFDKHSVLTQSCGAKGAGCFEVAAHVLALAGSKPA